MEENTYGGYVAASLTAHISHSFIPPESASSGSLRMYGVYVYFVRYGKNVLQGSGQQTIGGNLIGREERDAVKHKVRSICHSK